jgi:uncharacterized C2H2 Zn-finger protein
VSKTDWEALASAIDWDEFRPGRRGPRRIRAICRHHRDGRPTHEFAELIELHPFWTGRGYPVNSMQWTDITVRERGEKIWYFRCPKCRCTFRHPHRKVLIMIAVLDDLKQHETGRPMARAMRMDISMIERVLSS